MSIKIILRQKKSSDNDAVAALIHDSLNAWYKKNRGFDRVVPSVAAAGVYSRVYDELDPGCCVVAEDAETGRLAGSCFYHPRPTHVSLGIMTVAPEYFGTKTSTKLLAYIVDVAKGREQPLRLTSSAMNLDSFSLYNRAGFVPVAMCQDMQVNVPADGFAEEIPAGYIARDARADDVKELAALERELQGIDRVKDFAYFIENRDGIWGSSVLINESTGAIEGGMFSVNDPGCAMVGPGFARTESQAFALVKRELNRYRGSWSPIVLVPTSCVSLRFGLYALGARNTETHVVQVLGESFPRAGVSIPTFMPETS